MKIKNSRCLVLNSDYTPLTIIDWQRAIVCLIKYENYKSGLEIIDFYKDDYVSGTNNKKYPLPAVIKTNRYYRLHTHYVNFSRKNLFIRDDYTCQYCDKRFDLKYLTYDHVIPKSAWKQINSSPTTWTNIVTACVWCNRKKSNRTPKQASMALKKPPIIPNKSSKYLPVTGLLSTIRSDIPMEWKPYLPESYLI